MSLLFNRNSEKQNILIIEIENSIIFLELILHTNFQFPRFLNVVMYIETEQEIKNWLVMKMVLMVLTRLFE